MHDAKRPLIYVSYSWLPEDVDVNLAVWQRISDACRLLADEVPDNASPPPYYVSRIEDHVRRCDAFLALAFPRATSARPPPSLAIHPVDHAISPYTLFEVRLAERARKPRLVLHDSRTQVQSDSMSSPRVQYIPCRREDLLRQELGLVRRIDEWLRAIRHHGERHDNSVDGTTKASLALAPGSTRVVGIVRSALQAVGFTDISNIPELPTDVAMLEALRESRLLVADIGTPSLLDIYGMAHALGIPSIRTAFAQDLRAGHEHPCSLRGHAAGYLEDILLWTDEEQLTREVTRRAAAIRNAAEPITEHQAGIAHFENHR